MKVARPVLRGPCPVTGRGYPTTATMIPDMKQFQARHSLTDMVVVADAGMLSAGNLRELDEANLRFIVGSRMTKAPTDLASHFRWHGDAFTDGQLIDTITPRTGHTKENNPDLRAEPVWDPATHSGSWRAVWPTPASEPSATPPPSRPKRTGHARSSRDRKLPAPHASSRPPAGNAASTRHH